MGCLIKLHVSGEQKPLYESNGDGSLPRNASASFRAPLLYGKPFLRKSLPRLRFDFKASSVAEARGKNTSLSLSLSRKRFPLWGSPGLSGQLLGSYRPLWVAPGVLPASKASGVLPACLSGSSSHSCHGEHIQTSATSWHPFPVKAGMLHF